MGKKEITVGQKFYQLTHTLYGDSSTQDFVINQIEVKEIFDGETEKRVLVFESYFRDYYTYSHDNLLIDKHYGDSIEETFCFYIDNYLSNDEIDKMLKYYQSYIRDYDRIEYVEKRLIELFKIELGRQEEQRERLLAQLATVELAIEENKKRLQNNLNI